MSNLKDLNINKLKEHTDEEDFYGKLTEYAEVFTEKLIDVAPKAAEALLNLVQFKGGFEILTGVIALIIMSLALWLMPKTHKKIDKLAMESYPRDAEGYVGLQIAGWTATIFISCICVVAAIKHLFSFYNWLSLFYPEGAIAYKALEAVGINL